ncbi:MAG: hypothetical protein JO051_10080 [Acidobacteriaceae bacterium]|nr:hypothetical protein [Acidobacteriaceae bacterium]
MPGTRVVILSITSALVVGCAAVAADKAFQPGHAADYAHQVSDHVLLGAKSFDTEDLTAEAFGKKADLLKYGIVPVLVVIENQREKSLDLEDIQVSLVAADGRHVDAMNPDDIQFMGGKKRRPSATPYPRLPLPKKGNPLASPEVTARAFSAKMLPPQDSTNGFFFFEARPEPGDKLYVSGIRDARSGQEIMYFEFPLDGRSQ